LGTAVSIRATTFATIYSVLDNGHGWRHPPKGQKHAGSGTVWRQCAI